MKNKILSLLIISISLLVWSSPVHAAPVARTGDQVTVSEGEVIAHDYFSSGKSVTVAGEVTGDAYLAGESVVVTGTVDGDLLAAGQNVDIKGNVKGDLRVVGETVTISGKVAGNVTLGAKKAILTDTGLVGKNLLAGAQDLMLASPVQQDATVGVGTMTVSSTIGGDLNYWSREAASMSPGSSVTGSVTKHDLPKEEQKPAPRRALAGAYAGFSLLSALSFFVIAALILRLLPRYSEAVITDMRTNPWGSLGKGFVFTVGVPLLLLLLLVTVIGIPLALLGVLAYILAMSVAKVMTSYFLGVTTVGLLKIKTNVYLELVVGMLVGAVLKLIPFLGWLALVAFFFMAVGSLISHHRAVYLSMRSKKMI